MLRYLSKSIFLLSISVLICCVIYPLVLWAVAQVFFPFEANGSLLKGGPDNRIVGSKLIAQAFTKDEYFQPRPSACSYDASASASSSLAVSNYALRDRAARTLGPIVKYKNGQPVGPDIELWFKSKPNIVREWATLHNSLAQNWVTADPTHTKFVEEWMKTHPEIVAKFVKDNPTNTQPKAPDVSVQFFQNFSEEHPGTFPLSTSTDIQSIFFDMWRQDHPKAPLQCLPGDLVTASASGLDPHITLYNARSQLNRVATAWATRLQKDEAAVKKELNLILQQFASRPLGGLAGEKFVNVLEVNLELCKRYGQPA